MEKYKLTKEDSEKLKKISHQGAKKASESLTKLINQEVEVKALAVRVLPIKTIAEIIGSPEDIVTSTIMEVQDEVKGKIMIIYPLQSSFNVADFLAKREVGSTTKLDELDKSALKELGNILAGSFFSAISDYLDINMIESVPDIATDTLQATMDSVLAKFTKREVSSKAIVLEIDFEIGTAAAAAAAERISAYFILFLDVESAAKVFQSFKNPNPN